MTQTNKKGPIKTSSDAAPVPRPISEPPEISFNLRLKWGLALLGEEKAAEYLAWLRARLDDYR